MARRPWSIREFSRDVHQIDVHLPSVGAEQWVLLQSDTHWDSTLCDRDLLQRHLDLALERDAIVLDNGDFFDLMQSKHDKRGSKGEIRPEFCVDDYLGEVVRQAVAWMLPYKDILAVRGLGNHETAIRDHNNYNPTQAFVDLMRAHGAERIRMGGYEGWIKLQFTLCQNRRFPKRIHYFHGSGGEAPSTGGVTKIQQMAAYVTNADVVWTGHNHHWWARPIARRELTKQMDVREVEQLHLKTPGYKKMGAWEREKGHVPKGRGAYWLRFYAASATEVVVEEIRAK